MERCTFIIPTMGRGTLSRAVDSLKSQTVPDWKALVTFDPHYDINYIPDDPRVSVLKSDRGAHAGVVRNYAMDFVDTDWMAFLDDDDWLEKTYVHYLRGYVTNNPGLDLVIFTYKDVTNGNTIPPKKTKDFEACKVGISFAVRAAFVREHGIKFTPFSVEDFRFLDDCRTHGAKYLIPNNIQYFVGGRGKWLREEV